MNITRILGQNNRIYQKFGEYCITEAEPNQCCIICCFCQEEHYCEATFWEHIQQMHDYAPAQLVCMMRKDKIPIVKCSGDANDSRIATLTCYSDATTLNATTPTPSMVQPVASASPMYVAAEYLEGVALNDPQSLLELDDITNTFFDFKEKKFSEAENAASTNSLPEKENMHQAEHAQAHKELLPPPCLNGTPQKPIDIEKLTPKQLLENGKLLQCVFLQMQRANNEFKYKLNKLTQAVHLIECELKKEPGSRTLKRYMKIIPDQPFSSRDEVLLLDDELHHSKEMRDALHEETLAIATQNADVFCRIIWRCIMTDEVSKQFCWRGVINTDKVIKYPIKDMTILDVFQSVFREKFPEQALNFFKERTMTYFNKAHERLKRKQLNKVDGASSESNSCDFPYTKDIFIEQECDYKRARNSSMEKDDESVDAMFEKVFSD